MFNLHEFNNCEEDIVQINLTSTSVQFRIINLFQFSRTYQSNYFFSNVSEVFPQQIHSYIEKYKIKDKSIQTFAHILNGNDFQIKNDEFCDLSKLSFLFQVKSLHKCLEKYAKVHSDDVDFNINVILERNKVDGIFENDTFSKNAEDFLCINIDKCFVNEQFESLPISTIYRIIEKSESQKISSDILCEFIMKSIEKRHVLFSLLKLQNLSDNTFYKLFNDYSKNQMYYEYIQSDLFYIKSLKDSKQKLEKKVIDLDSNKKILEEQQIKMKNEKLSLETEIKEITKDKNELQIQLKKTIQDKHNLEELLKKTQEEKESIFLKHQDLINYNGLMIEKNKILEDENKLFHEKEKNIYYEMIDALFLNNSDINKFNISGKPILHFLCELGNIDLVKYFISIKTVDINLIWDDQWKKTALNVATEKNYAEIVKVLLTHPNINVNIKSTMEQKTNECECKKIGKTALYTAVENKNIEIVNYLLSHPKIDVNIKSESYEYNKNSGYEEYECSWQKREKTPLNLAVEDKSIQIIKLLLSHSEILLNISSLYSDGTEKYNKKRDHSSEKNKIDIPENKSSLHVAIENQDIEIVKLLLSNSSIDINFVYFKNKIWERECVNSFGDHRKETWYYDYKKTALHMAIESKNIDIIKILISFPGLDVNAKFNSSDSDQEEREKTALHMAIENNNIDIVKLLLSCPNIDVNIKDFYYKYYDKNLYERTPLNIAITNRNIDIVKLILENPNIEINKKSTRTYVKDKWQKKYELQDERAALLEAVNYDDLNIVKLLLENKNINANIKDRNGKSLIELARSNEIKSLLIAYLNQK